MEKRVYVYTDFDKTMINQDSALLLALHSLAEYHKVFGIKTGIVNVLRAGVNAFMYFKTGKTKHFYNAIPFFSQEVIKRVAEKLTFNPKWLAIIDLIKQKHGENVQIELIIISRNIIELIQQFIAINENEIKKITSHTATIIGHAHLVTGDNFETAVVSGVYKKELKTDLQELKNLPIATKASQFLRVEEENKKEVKQKMAGIIEKNKHHYIDRQTLQNAHYIGDVEETYLLEILTKEGMPKENFHTI